MPLRAQVRGEDAAESRARQSTGAEGGVERGENRAPDRLGQVHGRRVEGDVEAPVRGPEEQEDEAELERGVGQRGKRDRQRQQGRGHHGHRVVAVAAAQPAGHQHRGDRAHRHTEQGQSECSGRGVDLLLDGGDADNPPREDEAVEGEEEADRPAQPGHGQREAGFAAPAGYGDLVHGDQPFPRGASSCSACSRACWRMLPAMSISSAVQFSGGQQAHHPVVAPAQLHDQAALRALRAGRAGQGGGRAAGRRVGELDAGTSARAPDVRHGPSSPGERPGGA